MTQTLWFTPPCLTWLQWKHARKQHTCHLLITSSQWQPLLNSHYIISITCTHHHPVVREPKADPLRAAIRRPGRDGEVHIPTSHQPAGTVVTHSTTAARAVLPATVGSAGRGHVNICMCTQRKEKKNVTLKGSRPQWIVSTGERINKMNTQWC